MGKNTNQIATFSNLYSIGYRMPSSYSSSQCVTYDDLKSLNNSTKRMNRVYNAGLSYSYFNGNSTMYSYITVNANSGVAEYGSTNQSIVHVENTSGEGPIRYITLYTFTSSAGVTSGTMYLPSMSLYLTLRANASSIPTGTIHYQLAIKVGAANGGYICSTGWSYRTISAVTETYLSYTNYGSFSGMSGLPGGTTYYVVLEYYTTLSSYYYYGVQVSFTRSYLSSSSYIRYYLGTKCVPWNRIVGYNGQVPPSSPTSTTGARLPVYCYIAEDVTGKSKANTISFYYNYQLSGSTTWNTLETGRIDLGSDGKVDGSSSGTCYVLLNPRPSSGTVTNDYFAVKCYECGGNQTWSYKIEYNEVVPSSWTGAGKGVSLRVNWESSAYLGSYNDTLRQVTGVYFYID